jgi:hypothetical protein
MRIAWPISGHAFLSSASIEAGAFDAVKQPPGK